GGGFEQKTACGRVAPQAGGRKPFPAVWFLRVSNPGPTVEVQAVGGDLRLWRGRGRGVARFPHRCRCPIVSLPLWSMGDAKTQWVAAPSFVADYERLKPFCPSVLQLLHRSICPEVFLRLVSRFLESTSRPLRGSCGVAAAGAPHQVNAVAPPQL